MRWPFGPPHLTLKPSNKKTPKKKKKPKKKKNKQKNQKKKKKKTTKKKQQQKHQKMAFQLSVKFFLFFLVAFQNFPFLTSWPRKPEPPKHYKNRGFKWFFLETQLCVTKRPILDQKKPKFINSSYHFFGLFSSLSKNKKHKNLLKPLFL